MEPDSEKTALLNSYEASRSNTPGQPGLAEVNQQVPVQKAFTAGRFRRRILCRRRVRTVFSTGAILISVLLERITYFSIVGNLVLFCTNDLQMSSTLAVTINLIFTGI
jgi:hypothetical protein